MERYDDVSSCKSSLLPRPLLLPPRIGSDRRVSVLAWLIARRPSLSSHTSTRTPADTGGRSFSSPITTSLKSAQSSSASRDGHRFRFYAASRAFNCLEGQLFKSPKAAEAAALRHIVERSRRGRFDGIDVPHANATSHCVRRECDTAYGPFPNGSRAVVTPQLYHQTLRHLDGVEFVKTASSKGAIR